MSYNNTLSLGTVVEKIFLCKIRMKLNEMNLSVVFFADLHFIITATTGMSGTKAGQIITASIHNYGKTRQIFSTKATIPDRPTCETQNTSGRLINHSQPSVFHPGWSANFRRMENSKLETRISRQTIRTSEIATTYSICCKESDNNSAIGTTAQSTTLSSDARLQEKISTSKANSAKKPSSRWNTLPLRHRTVPNSSGGELGTGRKNYPLKISLQTNL